MHPKPPCMLLTVQIPVLPHVLKFLKKKHQGEFKLSRKHNEGKMLIHMLRNQQHDERFDVEREKYSQNLDVIITLDKYKNRGCNNITSRTIYDFNDFIDATIKDEFLYYVETLQEAGVKMTMDAMVDGFMGKYFFDDGDISPLTLKQAWYRDQRKKYGNKWVKRKKSVEIPGFSAVVVTRL